MGPTTGNIDLVLVCGILDVWRQIMSPTLFASVHLAFGGTFEPVVKYKLLSNSRECIFYMNIINSAEKRLTTYAEIRRDIF
jgi:hypothetical protein